MCLNERMCVCVRETETARGWIEEVVWELCRGDSERDNSEEKYTDSQVFARVVYNRSKSQYYGKRQFSPANVPENLFNSGTIGES